MSTHGLRKVLSTLPASLLPALLLALLALPLTAAAPAHAAPRSPAPADVCRPGPLAGARVSTWVRLEHHERTYSRLRSEFSVRVPGDWPLAKDLLLSPDSDRYIRAMACLTRPEPGQYRRWTEWRTGHPTVTSAKNGAVRVVDRTHSWVNMYRSDIDLGVWRVRAGAQRWTVDLRPPAALGKARWDEITVDPGGPGADAATPRPDEGRGATALVWHPGTSGKDGSPKAGSRAQDAPPSVSVSLKPSWQRSWAAQSDRLTAVGVDRAGTLLGTALVAALSLYAVALYRRRPGTPTAPQERTLSNLSTWAFAYVGLDVLVRLDDVFNRYLERRGGGPALDTQLLVGNALALAAAAVLLVVARPPRRFRLAAAVLALPPALVAVLLTVVPVLPEGFVSPHEASEFTANAQGIASCCVLALTSLCFVAAAWRLADDGGLLPASRAHPGRARVLRLRIAGPAILAWTLTVVVFFVAAQERSWLRATWLSDRTDPAYGTGQWQDFLWEALWSVANGQDWLLGSKTWLLTGVAVLAVLRTCRAPSSVSPLDDPADRLLFLTFFASVVALAGGYFVDNSALSGLSVACGALALYFLVAPFRHRSVLAQPFERSGRPVAESAGPATRAMLLDKARSYREIHAELRRLDQGLFGDVPPQRSVLERKLSKLHDWPSSGGPDRLPAKVSVVDTALALGPRDTWWANGSRSARLALLPAVPAALLMTWAWDISGEAWQTALHDVFGLPNVLLQFVSWMVTWVSGAFVLGALWRHLPGQRGAAKALPVALAFAAPIGLYALVYRFTDESTANLALAVSAMLFVLTVTGIALDFDTFRGERRYWQSRLGLLLSIYQMRYYSLQIAYLIAQIIAMISIWEFFTGPDVAPKSPEPR